MKVLFGMPLRQTTGFVESLLRLVRLDLKVQDFSTLCRRQKALNVAFPFRGGSGPLHLLIDATGIKAEGEGEWNARKHGGSKKRLWRKIHLGMDEETLEIRAVGVTTRNIGDAPMLPDLLEQIPPDQEIAAVIADGAYDTRRRHNVIAARGAEAIIPPRKKCSTLEANHGWRDCAKRSREGLQIGDGRLKSIEQSSSGSSVWRPNATMAASSASVRTVERSAFESVLKSSTVCRFRHFATVVGLIPSSRLRVASEACDR